MKKLPASILLGCAFALNSYAAVVEVTPVGFGVKEEVTAAADAGKVYRTLTHDVGKWWDPKHTYSGDSRNLSIATKPGGCFCENLGHGGAVEHARVLVLIPDSQLRMSGAFGPLQSSGLVGTLSVKLTPATGGTKIEMSYNVGGYMHGAFENIAPIVDGVLGEQLKRLKLFIETGKPL
jgi:hypothetical protein